MPVSTIARGWRDNQRHRATHWNERLIVGEVGRHHADSARINRPLDSEQFEGDPSFTGFDFRKERLFVFQHVPVRAESLGCEWLHFDTDYFIFHSWTLLQEMVLRLINPSRGAAAATALICPKLKRTAERLTRIGASL